jgi:hypothetical protein
MATLGLTAGELRDLLANVAPDTLVVLSCDSEGNGFSPLADGDTLWRYRPQGPLNGEIAMRAEVAQALDLDPSEEGAVASGGDHIDAFVLWPQQ